MARPKNLGLSYHRRSTGKQEISLPSQVEWAVEAARQHGVPLDASLADLAHMQARGMHRYKAIRLDDGITGADLNRPGFRALIDDVLGDKSISHVFIYKRDRFARPADAMAASQLEKQLLTAGVTIVFSDAVSAPIAYGEQAILRDIELLLAYYQGGEELRKHAERVLGFQRVLAQGGYRTGGNAPYGFGRVLVDGSGAVLEELPRGKTVRQPGCHVRVVPKDPAKIAVWLQILEWKAQGLGCKRIAQRLNERNIPSPDAGRTRTDRGVPHRVSGRWSPNTVAELVRNPIIVGVQEYGRRSEGSIRRLGAAGPRPLDEARDLTPERAVRVITNDPSLRTAREVGEAQYERTKWHAVQQQTQQRGRNQRGIPRAKDPVRYPLSCRLYDMTDGCGSVLYGRTTQGRPVYTCGRYMKTSGAECASNQVDAEAVLRFTLRTLRQFAEREGNREKLREKLLERARRAPQPAELDYVAQERARLQARLADLQEERTTIEYRMARERNDELYAALSRQYSAAQAEQAAVEDALRRLANDRAGAKVQSPEANADAALAILADVARIASDPASRAEVGPLLKRLGVEIGLTFGPAIKGKTRRVQRLLSGRMVFGGTPLPVPPFGADNVDVARPYSASPTPAAPSGRDSEAAPRSGQSLEGDRPATDREAKNNCSKPKTSAGLTNSAAAAILPDQLPVRPSVCQPEGISITKVSRGERIRTSDLLNPIQSCQSMSLGVHRIVHCRNQCGVRILWHILLLCVLCTLCAEFIEIHVKGVQQRGMGPSFFSFCRPCPERFFGVKPDDPFYHFRKSNREIGARRILARSLLAPRSSAGRWAAFYRVSSVGGLGDLPRWCSSHHWRAKSRPSSSANRSCASVNPGGHSSVCRSGFRSRSW
jgi:hypothetical protein